MSSVVSADLEAHSSDRRESRLLEKMSAALVPELRRYLERHRREIEATVQTGAIEAGAPAGRRFAKAYDGLLSALFYAAKSALEHGREWVPISLAAVGSYGRAMLSPYSDLDVRILCEREATTAIPVAEVLLYPLWDAGLNIGHQVVTTDDVIDLAQVDLPTATALLDWRVVASDSDAGSALLDRAFQGVFGPGSLGIFLDRLEQRANERRERFGGSVFLLEPDVKNGEGGLRDLDIAHWAARARWRIDDLDDLVRLGVLVSREWAEIEAARAFLLRVRNLLHLAARRRSDRLSFDQQEYLAERLSYGTGAAAIEHFMSDYYRQARAVARTREMLLSRAMPPPRRRPREFVIGRGLKIHGSAVSLVDADALMTDPPLALRLYEEAVRRNLPVYEFARHAVGRAVASPEFGEALRASDEAREIFVRLVCVVQHTKLKRGSVLHDLHDVGLLVAMIPEFAPVVGRVHHDVYHVYTVDVHSIAAVDQLRALCRGDLAAEYPLACRLAAELSRPRVVFFATLLHDVGKDIGGKDHPTRGARLARVILERLGSSDAEIVEVEHHVEKHLRMYHVATRRDLDDPKTIDDFCGELTGREGLAELYLLTMVDVTTTSPGSMTTWKRRMLDELFHVSRRRLSGGDGLPSERPPALKTQVVNLWPRDRDPAFIEHFLSGLPERYLHANDPASIVEHALFAEHAQARQATVRVVNAPGPYVELWVVADDRPGLLAMIAATLCKAKLKVLSAQVYSWVGQDGRSRSLDIFWVKDPHDEGLDQKVARTLERDLDLLLSGDVDATELATGRSSSRRPSFRPTPPVATKVNIDNRSAMTHTIVEVITRDREALLFRLSSTIQRAGLSIWFAKINTEGERAADVFYVSDERGGKVDDESRLDELKEQIASAITRLESGG